MDQRLERILRRVQKPARYTGGEYRQIIKDKAEVDLRLAFCFPDIYEIGMSNIGHAHPLCHNESDARRLVRACVCPVGRYGAGDAQGRHPALCT